MSPVRTGQSGNGPVAAADAPGETLADREARVAALRWTLHIGLPLAISLVLHIVVITVLGWKTFDVAGRPRAAVGEYEATLTERFEDRFDEALDWSVSDMLPVPSDAPEVAEPDESGALDELALSEFASEDATAGGLGLGAGEGLGLSDADLVLLGTGGGAGGAGTGGLGAGFGGGGGSVGQVGLWSLRVRADRVVYVVDFSGSIIVAVDDLKRELVRSVSRLAPGQLFDVIIFYSTGAGQDESLRTESFRPQLEPADERTRRAFFHWLADRVPRGRTEPLDAIQHALALGPDAIFFLSDGFFADRIVDDIERANRSVGARICCLVFDEILLQDTTGLPRETEGVRRLKRIAEANGGKVKIVTGQDLAQ